MEFSSISDRYIHLTYFNNIFEKKISPINLEADHQAFIGLSSISYLNDINENNFPGAKLGVYGSKYTNNKFIPVIFEIGNYNASTLCKEINERIKSVLPSSFKDWQLKFRLNSLINRVEVSIDGDKNVTKEDELFSVIIQQPLSYLLGFSDHTSVTTFMFGCSVKGFPGTPQTRNHAIADYRPKITNITNFFYICLKSIELECITEPFFFKFISYCRKKFKRI